LVVIEAARQNAAVMQITDRAVGKNLLAYSGSQPAEAARCANRQADLRALLEIEAKRAGGDVLCVTYQATETALREGGEIDGVGLAHIGAIRGKDIWRDVAGVVIAGRPQPNERALEDLARAVFWRDPRPRIALAPDGGGRARYD